jgi:integrase
MKYPGIVAAGEGKFLVTARIRHNGKIVCKQATINGTIQQARSSFETLKSKIRNAECSLKITNESTFDDLLTTYREKRGVVLKQDISRCDRLSRDLGSIPIREFPQRFESYIRIMRVTPTKKTGKIPSNGTINRILEIVKATFNLAVALEVIKENPVSAARFPKLPVSPRDRYLNDDERLRLFNAISEIAPHIEPFVRYSLMVPCRKGELIYLRRDAFNAITSTLYIPDSKAGIPIYKPIPDEMKSYFRSIPARCEYLFYRHVESTGEYLPLGDFRKSWKAVLKKAGIVNCRIHDLRHCAASDLTIAGNSERVIMDIAGWKTPMLSTYWHKNSLRSAQLISFPKKHCEGVCEGVMVANG